MRNKLHEPLPSVEGGLLKVFIAYNKSSIYNPMITNFINYIINHMEEHKND